MKLTYRGVSYEYTPHPVPPKAPSFANGIYRGQAIAFQTLTELPAQPAADLMWRGVPYHTGQTPAANRPTLPPVEATPPTATAPASGVVVAMARQLFVRHHQRSRQREQGMMVRLAAEVGIPVEDAAHYASRIQGELPHNFAGYDRSNSAMS